MIHNNNNNEPQTKNEREVKERIAHYPVEVIKLVLKVHERKRMRQRKREGLREREREKEKEREKKGSRRRRGGDNLSQSWPIKNQTNDGYCPIVLLV